jgi:KTSC domain
VKTTALESTTLRLVADNPDRKLLPIEFHNRALYQYFNVPADIHAYSKHPQGAPVAIA